MLSPVASICVPKIKDKVNIGWFLTNKNFTYPGKMPWYMRRIEKSDTQNILNRVKQHF